MKKTKTQNSQPRQNGRFKEKISKAESTIWSYKKNEITEIVIGTISSFKIDNLPECIMKPNLNWQSYQGKKNYSYDTIGLSGPPRAQQKKLRIPKGS